MQTHFVSTRCVELLSIPSALVRYGQQVHADPYHPITNEQVSGCLVCPIKLFGTSQLSSDSVLQSRLDATEPLPLFVCLFCLYVQGSSVIRSFAYGAMGHRIDPSWWTH